MVDISLKFFGVFCFSVLCFGLGTLIIGVLFSFGYNDCIFPIAWIVGTIVFGIAMMFVYGHVEAVEEA